MLTNLERHDTMLTILITDLEQIAPEDQIIREFPMFESLAFRSGNTLDVVRDSFREYVFKSSFNNSYSAYITLSNICSKLGWLLEETS